MGNKVLVVDDSALMRKVLRQVLTEAGFEVESARSGREGVELALAFEPDVVTLDINMPEMDGLTALSLLMWYVFAPMCLSTLATIRRETGGWRMPILTGAYLFALAYAASFVTYRLALALGAG